MDKILVAYATMAGSTTDVAQAIGNEIAKSGIQVEILPLRDVTDINAYDGVVVGAPMIMGWHREAMRFLKKHRAAWQHTPLAIFAMAISLTQTGETSVDDVPVYVDEKIPKPPQREASLNFRERYATLSNYIQPILKAIQPARPASMGIFGGRLEYGRLKWWAVLFVMLIIQAPAGDRRNWTAIQEWAAGIPRAFEATSNQSFHM